MHWVRRASSRLNTIRRSFGNEIQLRGGVKKKKKNAKKTNVVNTCKLNLQESRGAAAAAAATASL